MKKTALIAILLSLVIMISACPFAVCAENVPGEFEEYDLENAKPGDVNLDGKITAEDVTALARHVAKIEFITDKVALQNSDVTQDETITAEDVTHLARYVAKIVSEL